MSALPTVDVTGTYDQTMHAMLAEAAERGPLASDELSGAVVALRQHDVETLAHDQRLVGVGMSLFDLMEIAEGPLRDWYSRLMFTTEGDYHQRMRSLVARSFTPRAVTALRTSAAGLAADAVRTVRHGGDLVAAFSTLATRLMCELLGVPVEDVDVFRRWADALSPVFGMMTPEQISGATEALTDLLAYVDDLTERRAHDPEADLITALLAAEADGERLTHAETVTMIANLLVAGHDTAGSQIPCSILVALTHHNQLRNLWEDGAGLPSATSETIRLEPSIPVIPRTALAPVEVHGTTIPAGSLVYLCIAAASRDRNAWSEPERFDPARFTDPRTPRLLAFGAGTHYCLGTSVARTAVEESVRAVTATAPELRLSEDPAEIPWRQVLGRSPARLLVSAA